MYVGKYRPKYPALHVRLHRQLHLSLYLDLNLNLNLDLNPLLYRALFAKSYGSLLQQSLAALLGSKLTLCSFSRSFCRVLRPVLRSCLPGDPYPCFSSRVLAPKPLRTHWLGASPALRRVAPSCIGRQGRTFLFASARSAAVFA